MFGISRFSGFFRLLNLDRLEDPPVRPGKRPQSGLTANPQKKQTFRLFARIFTHGRFLYSHVRRSLAQAQASHDRPFTERLSLRVLALAGVELCQVVEARGYVGVLPALRLFPDRQYPLRRLAPAMCLKCDAIR